MSDAIAYCGQCGKMVTPAEIRTGKAIVTSTVAVCAACVAQLTPQQRAALMKMTGVQIAGPAPEGHEEPARPSGTRTKSSRTSGIRRASTRRRSGRLAQVGGEAPAQGKSKAGMTIMIGVVVLLFAGVFAFMFRPGDEKKKQAPPAVANVPPPPSLTKTPAVAEPAAAPGPAPAAEAAARLSSPKSDPAAREKRLDEIRWLINPSMDKYFEIQEKLDAFLADYPGDAEALALREPVDRKFGERADKELAAAVKFATELAAKGRKDQAARHMRSVVSRFGESEWYRTKGRKAVEEALAEIDAAPGARKPEVAEAEPERTRTPAEAKEKPSGIEAIRAAREAIKAREFEKARNLLAGRDEWRDSDRERADHLITVIEDAETRTAGVERGRGDPWTKFLLGFSEAGKKGLPRAREYLKSESGSLREADLGEGVARMGKLLRDAELVHDMVKEGFLSSKKPMRFVIGGKRVAGRVQSIEDGVIKLKTTIGREEQVRLSDVPPAELVEMAKLVRLGAVTSAQLASYYFALGDMEAAGKLALELTDAGASGLREDIEKLGSLAAKAVAEIELPELEEVEETGGGAETDPMSRSLARGLVAHWTLDGNAADSSEKGNDGAGRGGDWVDGKFGGAFRCKGDSYVEVPDSDSLKLQTLTVSAWIKFDKTIKDMKSNYPAIVNMHSWGKKEGFLFGSPDDRINRLGFRVFSGGRHLEVFIDETEPGKWVHVAGSYDGTHLRIYRDGEEVRSANIGAKTVDYDKRKLRIGEGLEGLVDDVRIYDRALSATEVAALVDGELAARVAATAAAWARGGPRITKIEAPPGGWPKEPLPGETGKPGQWAPGLIAEIFSDRKFEKRVGVRIDPAINHSFGEAGPDLGLPADEFAIRWTGWLLLPHEGIYSFEASANDAMKVYLLGKVLVDSTSSRKSPPRRYLAGLHPIVAEFKERTGGAGARLTWSGKELVAGPIPPEYFYHEVPEPGEYGPSAKLMRGLWAEYFQDEQFRLKVAEGPVESFNFDIGNLAPHPLCPDVKFGIRMRGYLLIAGSKEYTVSVKDIDGDGGVRVKIGGRTVLDSFQTRGAKVSQKTKLECGYQEFVCEYVGGGSDSLLLLSLRQSNIRPGDHDRAIFQEARPLRAVNRKGMAPGMRAAFFAGPKPRGRPIIRTYAPSADIAWKKGAPAPDVPQDQFSAGCQGVLLAPTTGKYLFRANLKGSAVITVGGRRVITCGKDPGGAIQEAGAAQLRAGAATITIIYSEANADPGMSVWWAGPTFGFRRLGGGALAHKARKLDVAEALPEEEAKPKEVAVVQTVVKRADGRTTVVRKTVVKEPEKKEPLPVGNVVGNGGFEVMGPEDFPQGWTKHNWSKAGNFSVRKDKTNTHDDSKYSLRVRPVGEGGKPGAFTRVTLPPGRYEVRFWACSDVDETAKVHVRLGDRELHWTMATEEWDQFKHTFEVTEKQSGATLGLYTTTSVVVWFDDVELEATKEQD